MCMVCWLCTLLLIIWCIYQLKCRNIVVLAQQELCIPSTTHGLHLLIECQLFYTRIMCYQELEFMVLWKTTPSLHQPPSLASSGSNYKVQLNSQQKQLDFCLYSLGMRFVIQFPLRQKYSVILHGWMYTGGKFVFGVSYHILWQAPLPCTCMSYSAVFVCTSQD